MSDYATKLKHSIEDWVKQARELEADPALPEDAANTLETLRQVFASCLTEWDDSYMDVACLCSVVSTVYRLYKDASLKFPLNWENAKTTQAAIALMDQLRTILYS